MISNMPFFPTDCNCNSLSSPGETFMEKASQIVGAAFANMKSSDPTSVDPTPLTCYSSVSDKSKAAKYESAISSKAGRYDFMADKKLFTYPLAMDIKSRNSSLTTPMGTWSLADGYKKAPNYDHKPIPRFFK